MTFYVIDSTNSIHNTDDTALGGIGLTLGAGDDAIIKADGSIIASGAAGSAIYINAYAESSVLVVNGFLYGTSSGIHSLGQYAQITINGQVVGDNAGISVSNSGSVYVSSTGTVSASSTAISISGNSSLVNDGNVSGELQLSSGRVTNNGLISSGGFGIFYGGDGAAYITNSGTMQGDFSTYYAATAETSEVSIENSGDWVGRLWLSPGDDSVINTGRITGEVYLDDGNNVLDSRYGFIGGAVTAGAGNDSIMLGGEDTTITPGGGADTVDGGAGFDIISYGQSPTGVTVDLLNGIAARGYAQGDRLSNIEGIYGSAYGDKLIGDNGNNTLNGVLGNDKLAGNGGNDTIIMWGAGKPVIEGGAGNDLIQLTTLDAATYGYAFRSVVQVNGGAGYDTLEIIQAPTMTFAASTVWSIERLLVGDGYNYNFTSVDATVMSGARLWVDGGSLTGTNYIRFFGSAETNGAFDFTGGAGRDTFVGGAGNDTVEGAGQKDLLTGGAGSDTFIYNGSAESLFAIRDQITDFNTAADTFQLDVEVTGVDGNVSGSVSYGVDLANLLSGQLAASHAILVNVTGGTLSGSTLLVVDANGVAGYQAAADYVLDVTGMSGALTTADFIL